MYTLEDLFMRWFYYETPAAWENQKKTFKALNISVGNGLSNKFLRSKNSIKTMLLFAENYPVSLICY